MAANRIIDLSSDTSTRPSPGMRKFMADAEVGDEQKAEEDPSTNALQERVATLLGKEAAVFLPSGTMCNQIALLVHCRPGDEIIAADIAHIFTSEASSGFGPCRGADVAAGNQARHLQRGRRSRRPCAIPVGITTRARVSLPSNRRSIAAAVRCGHLPPLEEVGRTAKRHGLAMHMDGARILNAVAASGIPAQRMTAHCDSVWVDLSKGLGCPVGGVLAGSKGFIADAWRWKHRLGGALRQSGMLAAAGLYALDHNVERLAEDHANARRLGQMLGNIQGIRIMNPEVETNIVFIDPSASGPQAEGHRRRDAQAQCAHGHVLRRHDPCRHAPRRDERRHGKGGPGLHARGCRQGPLKTNLPSPVGEGQIASGIFE